MMAARVALCVDELTCKNPGLVGLEGEVLEFQPWLDVFLSGEEARQVIGANEEFEEAWVLSCEDVEPINLAATLKADRPGLRVRLVEFEGCGSLFSRAHTALIDEVADQSAFLRRYAEEKRRFSEEETAPAIESSSEAVVLDPLTPESASVLTPTFTPAETEDAPFMQLVPQTMPIVQAGRAFLMPVVSGSGGAGKSSVSVMGACIARQMGYRTLLLDYDLQFGDVAIMAGVNQPLAIDEAILHPEKLEREFRRDPGLAVLAAPARLEASEETVRAMPRFLDEVGPLFDVIVANTGAAWADQHAVLLERCSTALFLVDQRASSVRACQHALELCARCGIASGPFQFAVNRCAKGAPLTSADVSCALQGAPVFELKEGGRDVEDYLSGGAAAELLETRNEFCTSLEHVMESLLPGAPSRTIEMPDAPESRRPFARRGRHAGRKRGRGAL
ncbi:MAG: chromosome partitioning protein ParA [Eggerthellaceae bacterium]|nr:chromosome partitioning protein ParA [Eggerthellaceae bacterium]